MSDGDSWPLGDLERVLRADQRVSRALRRRVVADARCAARAFCSAEGVAPEAVRFSALWCDGCGALEVSLFVGAARRKLGGCSVH